MVNKNARKADGENDENFYAIVLEELTSKDIKQGLWARALSETEMNEAKAKALYIKLRVEQLKSEIQPRHINVELEKNTLNPTISSQNNWFYLSIGIILAALLYAVFDRQIASDLAYHTGQSMIIFTIGYFITKKRTGLSGKKFYWVGFFLTPALAMFMSRFSGFFPPDNLILFFVIAATGIVCDFLNDFYKKENSTKEKL